MRLAQMSLGYVHLWNYLWMCERSLTGISLHSALLYLKDPTFEMSHMGKRHVSVDEVIEAQESQTSFLVADSVSNKIEGKTDTHSCPPTPQVGCCMTHNHTQILSHKYIHNKK